jgi:hypothetical protein
MNDSGNLPPAAVTTRRRNEESTYPGRVSIRAINPKEFKPVDGWPDKKPCIVCGRKLTLTRNEQRVGSGRERSAKPVTTGR